ncbi:MAG TPA: hypothetical protein VI819_02310 [Patescibacteria group bacterium]|nr:hypothetical protein [Patescibacteria group bacterium]
MNIYKQKIRDFDFADPDFSWLPADSNLIDRLHLTKMERDILDGIVYQHNISKVLSPQMPDLLNGFYRLSLSGAVAGVFLFVFLMISYYVNVNYNLGFTFLTNMFA